MAITALTVEWGTRNGQNYAQVKFEGTHTDSMGQWQNSGVLADIHLCDGYLILISPFNSKPLMVCKDTDDVFKRLKERYHIDPKMVKK